MHAAIDMHVIGVSIKKYEYKDMEFAATLNGGNISSNGNINDSNLKFHYDLSANVATNYPTSVNALFVLDTLHAQKLNLYNDPLNACF
ncbi:MAG: hypothetical protein WDM71_09515 [Ferruginibacter sp.]